jgi:hypothetical protein
VEAVPIIVSTENQKEVTTMKMVETTGVAINCDADDCDWSYDVDPEGALAVIRSWHNKRCPKCNGKEPVIDDASLALAENVFGMIEVLAGINIDGSQDDLIHGTVHIKSNPKEGESPISIEADDDIQTRH